MPDLVSIGEALIQLSAVNKGPLRHAVYFERHIAGAEANVAVCLVRQGFSSAFVGRVGDDEFGLAIINWLRGEGVDTSYLKTDPGGPTGLYLVQRGFPVPERSRVFYYRRGSAGSRLSPEDIPSGLISSARILHLTGITPALSPTALEACRRAAEIAEREGIMISFDTNIRRPLWRSMEEASKTLRFFVERSDILFTDPGDASIILAKQGMEEAMDELLGMGIGTVVMKLGARGATAARGRERASVAARRVQVEDVIGAGDVFAGTFLSCLLSGMTLSEALRRATAAGTLVVTVRGDQENIPSMRELEEYLSSEGGGPGA